MFCVSYANRGLNVLDTITTVKQLLSQIHAAAGIVEGVGVARKVAGSELLFQYHLWLNAVLQLADPLFDLS